MLCFSACESQSLVPAQANQLQLTQAPRYVDGYGLFVQAINENNLSDVKRVVEAGLSPTRPSGTGSQKTFVHLASERGRLEILRYFITELNIDPNFAPMKGDRTPLHDAVLWNHQEIVPFLIEANRSRSKSKS